jgi:hypothetical protein
VRELYKTKEGLQLHPGKLDKKVCGLIEELTRQGITQSLKQTEALERDHGIRVPPHVLAEYKYHEKKAAFYERAKRSKSE